MGSEFAFEKAKNKLAAAYQEGSVSLAKCRNFHYADAPCADFQIEWAWMVAKQNVLEGLSVGACASKTCLENIFIPFWFGYVKDIVILFWLVILNDKANRY